MQTIRIGNQSFEIKDYYCSPDQQYFPKRDGRLWLYVHLTDVCPAACPFCVNPGRKSGTTPFDIRAYETILRKIRPHIHGVSFTGGEPMLTPELLDEAVHVTSEVMDEVLPDTSDLPGHEVEIDMVTNGIHLEKIPELHSIDRLDSIHISRHRIDDGENSRLMGIRTPSLDSIRQMMSRLHDPGQVVFNCLLSKQGIHSAETIAAYLEMAAETGVLNSSFIGIMPVNAYCIQERVDPGTLDLSRDPRFHVWNHFHDYDYCSCSSGHYHARARYVRFYYRAVGTRTAPYSRQIVYTHDNRLLKGFGGEEIVF